MSNESTAGSKDRYERVLTTVDLQTSSKQLPGCTKRSVLLTLVGHGPFEHPGKIESSLRATVENGDCLKWADEDGKTRYTLTGSESLRRLLVYEAQKENPREELKERVKSLLP